MTAARRLFPRVLFLSLVTLFLCRAAKEDDDDHNNFNARQFDPEDHFEEKVDPYCRAPPPPPPEEDEDDYIDDDTHWDDDGDDDTTNGRDRPPSDGGGGGNRDRPGDGGNDGGDRNRPPPNRRRVESDQRHTPCRSDEHHDTGFVREVIPNHTAEDVELGVLPRYFRNHIFYELYASVPAGSQSVGNKLTQTLQDTLDDMAVRASRFNLTRPIEIDFVKRTPHFLNNSEGMVDHVWWHYHVEFEAERPTGEPIPGPHMQVFKWITRLRRSEFREMQLRMMRRLKYCDPDGPLQVHFVPPRVVPDDWRVADVICDYGGAPSSPPTPPPQTSDEDEIDVEDDAGTMSPPEGAFPPEEGFSSGERDDADVEDIPEEPETPDPIGDDHTTTIHTMSPTTSLPTMSPLAAATFEPTMDFFVPRTIDSNDWTSTRYVGLGLLMGTLLASCGLGQLASFRRRRRQAKTLWGNLATEEGVEELLRMGWKVTGSKMEVYDKKGFGYQDDNSILMGGYEQGIKTRDDVSRTQQESVSTPDNSRLSNERLAS